MRRVLGGVAISGALLATMAVIASSQGPEGPQRPQAPEPAPPPGAKLEVIAAQTILMATAPSLLNEVPVRAPNAFGTAQHGARFTLVMVKDDYYKVAIDCQEGKIRVEGWVDRRDVRPVGAALPSPQG